MVWLYRGGSAKVAVLAVPSPPTELGRATRGLSAGGVVSELGTPPGPPTGELGTMAGA